MKIAYVCADPGVPVFGRKGCSIHVQEVLRSLLDSGATVELFASRIGGDPPPGLENVRVRRLPRVARVGAGDRERFALAANLDLFEALGTDNGFDFIYERHSIWSYAGMEYAQQRGIPGLLEVNAPLLDEQRRYRGLVLESAAEEAVGRAYRAATDLLAVSDGVAAYLNRHPAVRGAVHVVPNGVDAERFTPEVLPSRPAEGVFTIGFVGTLKPWHGVEQLVAAAARIDPSLGPLRLLIVGDGPQRDEIEAQAAALGLADSVELTGAVTSDDVPALLTSMDVAVAPYPQLEEFYFSPLKIFEYMASGRAVVAASIGQIREVIADGSTGLLYAPGDLDALAGALTKLRVDAELCGRLGGAARSAVMSNRSWGRVAGRIMQIARSGFHGGGSTLKVG
jgi:glycosyltransferase involved in cell wall biosynthesis